jgi:hypothetical protein
MKSVDGIVSIPASSHAAIFAPSNDRFATAITFKTLFDLVVAMHPGHCERSDPFFLAWRYGLLRSARNDG